MRTNTLKNLIKNVGINPSILKISAIIELRMSALGRQQPFYRATNYLRYFYTSVCSAISNASSTSIPR